jgi:hypothetical protein
VARKHLRIVAANKALYSIVPYFTSFNGKMQGEAAEGISHLASFRVDFNQPINELLRSLSLTLGRFWPKCRHMTESSIGGDPKILLCPPLGLLVRVTITKYVCGSIVKQHIHLFGSSLSYALSPDRSRNFHFLQDVVYG